MDYLSFYNLDAQPFQNDPDSRFYYESNVHKQARLRLMRGIQQRKALSLLIGEPGCGKTMLAHHLLENLDADRWALRMVVIPHAACPSGWLIRGAAKSFGVAKPAEDPLAALAQLSKTLIRLAAGGAEPVLFVDEAQLLSNKDVVEDFRALLCLVDAGRHLLSLVLFGLPSLAKVLRLESSLAQRIEIRAEMDPMDREQLVGYVRHRITCASGAAEIFSPDAVEALYTYSNGVPRLINTLADNALFEGAVEGSQHIYRSHIIAAANQLGLEACVAPAPRVSQFRSGVPDSQPEMLAQKAAPPTPLDPLPEGEPLPLKPSPEDDEVGDPAETLTAISLTEDDTDISMEQMIAEMDEAEAVVVEAELEPAPAALKRPAAPAAPQTPTRTLDMAEAELEALLEGFEDPEEVELAVPRGTRNERPLRLEPEEESLDTVDKFESLWSNIEPDVSGFPPAASATPKRAAPPPPQDEEVTVVGLPPAPEPVTTPQSAVGRSAQASADEIDALFDEISLED